MIYSVIIPHKNTPDLLCRLIDSIPDRQDIEILLIDNSEEPLSIKDIPIGNSNVKILYSDYHKGAGHARNIGLSKAIGKWIVFADADDFFSNNAFSIFDKYKESHSDIIYFGVTSCFSNTLKPASRAEQYVNILNFFLNNNASAQAEELLRFKYIVPWGKMIKFDLIKQYAIQFDEVLASNDVIFSLKTGFYANTISAEKEVVYSATVREESLTQIYSRESNFSRYLVALRYNQFLRENEYSQYQISVLLYLFRTLKYGPKEFLKACSLLIKFRNNIFNGYKNWPRTLLAKFKQVD